MTTPTMVSTRARPRLLAGLATAFSPFLARRRAAAQAEAPDIVVVVINDARAGDEIGLPQTMARLRDGGTTFPNFFLTTPLCCPSRATIFTGLYAHNTGVYENTDSQHGGWEGFARHGNRTRTTGLLLQDAGYRTVSVGTYLNGEQPGRGLEPGWDVGPIASGKKKRRNKKRKRKKRHKGHGHGGKRRRRRDRRRENRKRKQKHTGHALSETQIAEAAVAALAAAPLAQPLYLHIGFGTPHVPVRPVPPYAGQFAGVQVDRNPSFNEADMGDKPGYMRSLKRLTAGEEAWLDGQHQGRLECLLRLDDEIAKVWEALKARGRLDNTYVFFLTDNGYLLGQHRYYGKHVPYDGSARMPLYAFGPAFAPGTADPRLVGNVDIAPTLVDLAGADAPAMDGVSLLSGQARADILLEFLAKDVNSMKWPGPRTEVSRYSALRTDRHLYVEHHSGAKELYDYQADPHETENLLAGTPSGDAAALAASLSARLSQVRSCRGGACP